MKIRGVNNYLQLKDRICTIVLQWAMGLGICLMLSMSKSNYFDVWSSAGFIAANCLKVIGDEYKVRGRFTIDYTQVCGSVIGPFS